MFGWEFPPFQAGGLATATVGLVKGLLRNQVTVTLVVPFHAEASPRSGLRLVSADGPAEALTVHRIQSPMTPYGGADEYVEVLKSTTQPGRSGTAGVYGGDLFQEVERALESLRLGTPCIIPRTAGVAEVVANTFKVDFWDVDEMTNQIVAILRHPVLRDELSANARRELGTPRFGLEEPARLTAVAYSRALEGSVS